MNKSLRVVTNIKYLIVEYLTNLFYAQAMRIKKFLAESPLFGLYTTYDQVLGHFEKQLKNENVGFLQALILTGIFFEEAPVRPTQLAKILQTTPPNMSQALKTLEWRGFIERTISKGDARAYLFNLTSAGRRKVPKLIKIFDSIENEVDRSLDSKKVVQRLEEFKSVYLEIVGETSIGAGL